MAPTKIVGHHRPREILRRMIRGQRLPHALLFEGPEGIGKKKVALWTFQATLCEVSPGEGCGECDHCEAIERLLHPDLYLLEPQGDTIRVEQIREVEALLRFKPIKGKARALIIDDAHRMTMEASNSLLKTLEEPPPYTIILLITPMAEGLLPTVRSRCQKIRFFPLKPHEVLEVLEGLGVPRPEDDRLLLDGSPGRILRARKEDFAFFLDRVKKGGINEALAVAEEVGQDREKAMAFLRFLMEREGRGNPDLFWKFLHIYRCLQDYANPRLGLEAALLEVLSR